MFPENCNSEFAKGNYLISSDDSINKKEDRILNREYDDPYRYEKKMAKIYERENHANKYNLNTISNEPLTGNSDKNTEPNISFHKCTPSTNAEDQLIPNLNYNYEDYNKYKRRDRENNSNYSINNLLNTSNSKNNIRYKRESNYSDEFPSNLSIVNFSNQMNANNREDFSGTPQSQNQNQNDLNQYNSEMNYYRNMIENMHSEIGSLNNKLTEIEKTNNIHSYQNTNNLKTYKDTTRSCTNSNSHLSTANFKNVVENSKEHSHIKDEKLFLKEKDYPLKEKENFLIRTEFNNNENSYSNNNSVKINTSVSEPSISGNYSQYNTINNNYNADIPENHKLKRDYLDYLIPKNYNEPDIKRKPRDEKTNKIIQRTNSADRPKSTNKKQINKIPAPVKKILSKSQMHNNIKSKSKPPNKNNKPIETKSKSKEIKSPSSTNEILTNVRKENEELKSKIFSLEKSLKNINDQVSLDTIEKRGKDHLRVELEIWKNRSEDISKSYLDNLSGMKKQLLQDKTNFIGQIKSLQTNFSDQIHSLKQKYQSTLDKYEINMKKLRKENEELKKKVSKVKEILNPNH